jgi:Helitron helicase-like domain at N-terminus
MDLLNTVKTTYPGLCALNFDYLLDIVLERIVGANDNKSGLFGTLDAYGVAVEEQGRKTLHAHILVYISGWNKVLQETCTPPYVVLRMQHSNRLLNLSILSFPLL